LKRNAQAVNAQVCPTGKPIAGKNDMFAVDDVVDLHVGGSEI
jgi:hypothetical protein